MAMEELVKELAQALAEKWQLQQMQTLTNLAV